MCILLVQTFPTFSLKCVFCALVRVPVCDVTPEKLWIDVVLFTIMNYALFCSLSLPCSFLVLVGKHQIKYDKTVNIQPLVTCNILIE